jgi:hypothetical protein
MMWVGILGFWQSAIVRKITRGDKGNWPRKGDRWQHEAGAPTRPSAAAKATKTRADERPASTRSSSRASREAVGNVGAEQQGYLLPEEKPANEAVTAEQTMPKPKHKRARLLCLVAVGSPRARVRTGFGLDRPAALKQRA